MATEQTERVECPHLKPDPTTAEGVCLLNPCFDDAGDYWECVWTGAVRKHQARCGLYALATENADLRRQLAEAEGRAVPEGWMPTELLASDPHPETGCVAHCRRFWLGGSPPHGKWMWEATYLNADGYPRHIATDDPLRDNWREAIAAAEAAQGETG